MFSKSAELYDKIYFGFKDYEAEAEKISEWIRREHPTARTLLDVACGTGEHARILHGRHRFEVDGVDLDEALVSLARRKNPDGAFHHADMVDFDLGTTYDVVICLFSAIGYVKTLERVTQALERFKVHTREDGLVLVEPWFPPGVLTPGQVHLNTADTEEIKIARMAYSTIRDRISTLRFEYLIGSDGKIEHEVEEHELGLFTVDEMKRCFEDAGLTATYDEEGTSGRGLYTARRRLGNREGQAT